MSVSTSAGRQQRGGMAEKAAAAGPALLALGIGWVLFALAIPMFGLTTAKSIAILLAILLLLSAVSELATAVTAHKDWQPTHALMALLFVAGAIVMLVWSSPTLAVVGRITAWYLLVKGIHDIATAFAQRRAGRQGAGFGTDAGGLHGASPWWAPLVVGAFSIGIAFWAASQGRPSLTLVLSWVALAALVTGLTKIAAAFRSHQEQDFEADSLSTSGFGSRAAAEAGRADTRADTRAESRAESRTRPPMG